MDLGREAERMLGNADDELGFAASDSFRGDALHGILGHQGGQESGAGREKCILTMVLQTQYTNIGIDPVASKSSSCTTM